MSLIMYHDEPALRDVVVLDPVKFLVEPATLIIRERRDPNSMHQDARELRGHKDYKKLTSKSEVSTELLHLMWAHLKDHQVPMLTALLLKYGLLVRLQPRAGSKAPSYLVPTILQPEDPDQHEFVILQNPEHSIWVALFLPGNVPEDNAVLTAKDFKFSFTPEGLFALLLGKLVEASQSQGGAQYDRYQRAALLDLGGDKALVRWHYRENLIELQLKGVIHLKISLLFA